MRCMSVSFDSQSQLQLDKLKRHYNCSTISSVLRKAITLLNLNVTCEKENARLIIRDSEGKERQILII